jgi:spore coat polysaccharide biosynthesis predicted glycosyltransferase SpsG/RimJ/RimL family protein N-acetyltransferase
MSECARLAPNVVVRADASPEIGLGHVMRSLALAHELTTLGCATTICGIGVPTDLVGSATLVVPSATSDAAAVVELHPDLVVVDGYHFTEEYFAVLDDHGIRYGVIDDDGDTPARRPAVVVNQNPHAIPEMYDHLDGAPLLLLGTRFALLRTEILEASRRAPARRPGSVFVAFGGSDPRALTAPVAVGLASAGLDVRVAVGPSHPDRTALVALLGAEPGIVVVEPADYAGELAAADAAVLAAGSSLLEAACLGTPAVAVVVADNQRRLAAACLDQGLVSSVVDADRHALADVLPDAVTAALHGPRPTAGAVPGTGARLVAAAVADLISSPVRLRPATIDDADFLFALRNDDDVRRRSFHPPPTWDEHLVWLGDTIGDPERRLFVVESGSRPVGQARLDTFDDHEVVSLALVEQARGRGLGRGVLGALTALTARDLVAYVQPGNARSLATFSSAGFVVESDDGHQIVMRRRSRPDPETTS